MEITLKDLYKVRPQIMGISALLVIIGHLWVGPQSHLVESIHRFAQIGVDIFFFLSGIGCYQSISKRSILDFYQQRLKRILPVYLFILIGYGIFKCVYEEFDILSYLWAYSLFMFPIGGQVRHWFIFGILIAYLLTPIFYKMIGHHSFWASFIIIIFISSQVWFSPWPVPDNLYGLNEFFIARIPVYMFGMYFGEKFSKNETIIINFKFYLELIGIIILMFWDSYFNDINIMSILHYMSILGATYITFLLVMVFNKIKIKVLPLEWLGKCSLESYLINEKIAITLMTYTLMTPTEVNIYSFILTFIVSIILKLLFNLIIDKKLGL